MFWPSTYPASRSPCLNASVFSFWKVWMLPILGSLPAAALGGNLAFTEPRDTAVFSGQLTGYVGTLIVTEAADTASFVGLFGELSGGLNTIEAPDQAFFDVFSTPIPPVLKLEVLRFGIPVSLSRW